MVAYVLPAYFNLVFDTFALGCKFGLAGVYADGFLFCITVPLAIVVYLIYVRMPVQLTGESAPINDNPQYK